MLTGLNIRELVLKRFTSYDSLRLVFPETGIMVVTGPNGSGKSSIIEGVAWAVWGKTLRDTVPWRQDVAKLQCSATLRCDGLLIDRQRKAKTNLQWMVSDDGTELASILDTLTRVGKIPPGHMTDYETATKAQETLDHIVGPFDVWRRSRAFSSHDAAHFTLATDGERKRLLESAMGLGSFDTALEACRVDLKKAQAEAQRLRVKKSELDLKIAAEKRRLEEAEEGLAAMPKPPAVKKAAEGKPLADFEAELRRVDGELRQAREVLRKVDTDSATLEATAAGLRATLARLRDGACPTCTQPITAALRASLKEEAEAAEDQAKADRVKASGKREDAEALFEELTEELAAIRAKRDARQAELQEEAAAQREADRHTAQRERYERIIKEAKGEKLKLEEDWQDHDDMLALASTDLAELTACETVLGLRGVRANILGRSLSGIEAVANAWLPRMLLAEERGISVKLQSYSEKKTGGVADAINLQVLGVGDGNGYRATSGGERRRIDVGLLLALAEVAAASAGGTTGTLFFDEVFDALDSGGKEAVAGILRELSEDRCVVVVTHSEELQSLLPAVKRVQIARGVVTELG